MKTNPSPLVLAITILCLGSGLAFELTNTLLFGIEFNILIFVGLLSGSLLFRNKKVFNFLAIFSAIVGTIYLTSTIVSSVNDKDSTYDKYSTYDDNEKESLRVYRIGYSDGRNAYGLPASNRASAYEVYLAKGYKFRDADYKVYVMGYEDGMYGRNKRF